MDPVQYINVKMDVECGKYACLQQCCMNMSDLRAVWMLMQNTSEADLVKLQVLLCGCAVPKAQAPGSQQTPGANQNTIPTGVTCSDVVTKWACEPTNRLVINSIGVGLAAASLFAAKVPAIAIIVGGISLVVDDLTAGCDEMAKSGTSVHTWTDNLIDKLCGMAGWLDTAKKKAPTALSPIADLMTTVQNSLTFMSANGGVCCTKQNAGNSLPDLGQIPTEVPTTPTTTTQTSTGINFGPSVPPPPQTQSGPYSK